MKELRRYLLPVFGFTLLITALLFAATPSSQAVPTDKDVRVVNTTVEPIPTAAQGTTQIAGNVAVSSLPAVQLVAGSSVSVSSLPGVQVNSLPAVQLVGGSTVNVGNTSANPIPVVNLGGGSSTPLQPVQVDTSTQENPGSNVSTLNLFTVPAGKTLVIEFVTMTGQVPLGQHVETMEIISVAPPFGGASHQMLVNPQPDAVDTEPIFRASQMVKIYAQTGSTVQALFRRSASNLSATYGVSISGYLVDN